MYPYQISRWSARHRGGTKDYHLVLIEDATRAMVINRWGKAQSWGSTQINCYADKRKAFDAFSKKRIEKSDRGYSTILVEKQDTAADQAELKKVLGQGYWFNFGAENLKWLDGDVDTSGVKDPEINEWAKREDGSFEKVEKRKLAEEVEPTFEEKVAEQVAKNPNWGMF